MIFDPAAGPADSKREPHVAPGSLARAGAAVQRFIGLVRSIFIYYGQPLRHRKLVRFYSRFISSGDLCFDLGAHLGNRTRAWLSLGARVVAVEPQPLCVDWLRRWFGGRPEVELVAKAVGAEAGEATMWLSRLTPTVSTVSPSWRRDVETSPGFSRVRWQEATRVEVVTLDDLIAEHGVPAFCKVDVEGAELEVLQGCSTALPAVSFEFIPAADEIALGCIQRLEELGRYEYQYGVGEPPELRADRWMAPQEINAVLKRMEPGTGSGDVYARRKA